MPFIEKRKKLVHPGVRVYVCVCVCVCVCLFFLQKSAWLKCDIKLLQQFNKQ